MNQEYINDYLKNALNYIEEIENEFGHLSVIEYCAIQKTKAIQQYHELVELIKRDSHDRKN